MLTQLERLNLARVGPGNKTAEDHGCEKKVLMWISEYFLGGTLTLTCVTLADTTATRLVSTLPLAAYKYLMAN